MEAREPKEVEEARTAIFVRGTHTGEVLNNVMKELVRLAFALIALIVPSDNVPFAIDGAEAPARDLVFEKEHGAAIRGPGIARVLGEQERRVDVHRRADDQKAAERAHAGAHVRREGARHVRGRRGQLYQYERFQGACVLVRPSLCSLVSPAAACLASPRRRPSRHRGTSQ